VKLFGPPGSTLKFSVYCWAKLAGFQIGCGRTMR